MADEESSLNTPLDGGDASLETLTQLGVGGVTQDPENIDARLLCAEVKEIGNVVKTLVTSVNAALMKIKDVDTRIEDVQTAQTGIVAKLEVFDKLIPQFVDPCKEKSQKSVPKTGGNKCKGNVDGNPDKKKRGRKGKGKASFLANDIMNIEFDFNVDNGPAGKNGADIAKRTESSEKQPMKIPEVVIPTPKTSRATNTPRATMNPRFSKSSRSVPSVHGIGGAFDRQDHDKLDKSCKKLFRTTPTTKRDSKVRKVDPTGGKTSDVQTSSSKNATTTDLNTVASTSPVLHKFGKSKFRPPPEMCLTLYESQVAAYLFGQGNDPEEPLVRMDEFTASRKDLNCLIPSQSISKKIMNLVAKKISLSQTCHMEETIWCLPPSFVDNVYNGKSIADLCTLYLKGWMYPFRTLKYIYVPIVNEANHWFLMVISPIESVLYHFDCNLNDEDISRRNETMRTLCGVIVEMIGTSEDHENEVFRKMVDCSAWQVKKATGIPNTGTSVNSAVWVLSWLEMEGGFQHNKTGKPHDDVVRMTTVVELLCGDYNELRRTIEEKARVFWNTV